MPVKRAGLWSVTSVDIRSPVSSALRTASLLGVARGAGRNKGRPLAELVYGARKMRPHEPTPHAQSRLVRRPPAETEDGDGNIPQNLRRCKAQPRV